MAKVHPDHPARLALLVEHPEFVPTDEELAAMPLTSTQRSKIASVCRSAARLHEDGDQLEARQLRRQAWDEMVDDLRDWRPADPTDAIGNDPRALAAHVRGNR